MKENVSKEFSLATPIKENPNHVARGEQTAHDTTSQSSDKGTETESIQAGDNSEKNKTESEEETTSTAATSENNEKMPTEIVISTPKESDGPSISSLLETPTPSSPNLLATPIKLDARADISPTSHSPSLKDSTSEVAVDSNELGSSQPYSYVVLGI